MSSNPKRIDPIRGARLLLLPRYFAHLKETEQYTAALVCDGPIAAAKQPQFKTEAYGLFHAATSACETLAEAAVPLEHAALGSSSPRRAGIVNPKLLGGRTHLLHRRNGISFYSRLAVEDEYVVCLVVPRLPTAELGAALLDAVIAEGLVSADVADPDHRGASPSVTSLKQALDAEASRQDVMKRFERALAWVEDVIFFGVDPASTERGRALRAQSVCRAVTRWGLGAPSSSSPANTASETLVAAAHHWLLSAACLHRPTMESVVAFATADSAPRWSLLGGAVYNDGVALASSFPSTKVARQVALLALSRGFMDGFPPESAVRYLASSGQMAAAVSALNENTLSSSVNATRTTDQSGASADPNFNDRRRQVGAMAIDVTALLNEIEREEGCLLRSAMDRGCAPVVPNSEQCEGSGVLIPPFHPPVRRAILLLACKRATAMACIYVPSTQPYVGTHIDAAVNVLAHAAEHMADATPDNRPLGSLSPARLLASANAGGTPLHELVRACGAQIMCAASVAPSQDLRWFEVVDATTYLDSTLRALVTSRKKNINAEETAKVAAKAVAPHDAGVLGLLQLLHGSASEALRAVYRRGGDASSAGCGETTVSELLPSGPLSNGCGIGVDDEFDKLLCGSNSRKKKVLERDAKASAHALAREMNAASEALAPARYILAVSTSLAEGAAAETEQRDGTVKDYGAVACLVRFPPSLDRREALSMGCAVIRAVGSL